MHFLKTQKEDSLGIVFKKIEELFVRSPENYKPVIKRDSKGQE